MKLRVLALIMLLQLCSAQCFADLPLTIDDLLTKHNQFRLSLNLGYDNVDRDNNNAQFVSVQTGDHAFMMLPAVVGERQRNSDIFTLTLGGRYGVTSETELYSRLTATAENTRILSDINTNSHTSEQLSQLVFGVNHQFSEDNDSPALLLFGELVLAENTAIEGAEYVHFKTGQIGFTTYRSIDPLVLSLTAGYQHSWRRETDGEQVNPGDLLFINPSVGFAVNSQVTLTGGVEFKFRGRDRIDGRGSGIRTSQTDLELGLGYASSEKLTINLTVSNDISGNTGAQANMGLIYKLKK